MRSCLNLRRSGVQDGFGRWGIRYHPHSGGFEEAPRGGHTFLKKDPSGPTKINLPKFQFHFLNFRVLNRNCGLIDDQDLYKYVKFKGIGVRSQESEFSMKTLPRKNLPGFDCLAKIPCFCFSRIFFKPPISKA